MTKPQPQPHRRTRGERNNNLLNIRRIEGKPRRGEVPPGEMTTEQAAECAFCVFRTVADGLREAAVILLHYQRAHGLRTIRQMIGRWAPGEDNNRPDLYARFVAARVGVPPDAPVDVSDYRIAAPMLSAMAQQESGTVPRDDDLAVGLAGAGILPPQHRAGAGGAAALLLPLAGVPGLAAAALLATAGGAHAADAAYQAAVSGFIEWAIGMVCAVLTAVLGWAIHWAERKLRLDGDAAARGVIETALDRGLGLAREMMLREAHDLRLPHVRSKLVQDAATYVLGAVPGALERFGLTEQAVQQRLTARLDAVAPLTAPPNSDALPVSTTERR